ncbi:MAG: alanine--tRNA ligase [Planctomycetota bacterium]
MRADELRQRYLEFFRGKDHKVFPSDSLVPEGDASVLFTGAGMNQFKDAFLGKAPPDLIRATSSQKCLRMPDLDNVGRTRSHHTFFEMLGNFSFGDYFKVEAIRWAMEFLEKELALPRERLAMTVYLDDDEAARIWEEEIGMPKERIWRYGAEDNFWPAEAPSKGPNGPCGPCSEIYFDFGPSASLKQGVASDPAGDSDRYVEIWNLVFTQFDRTGVNQLQPLPRRNIDTGAGFERILRVLQEKPNNFEIDLFEPIMARIVDTSGVSYGAADASDVKIKRIADHVRAATFCIADGVRPGNEGRGYVVRKIVRRAAVDLLELGRDRPGLSEVVPGVVEAMGSAYPEIREHQGLIQETIAVEEERFGEVYRIGYERLAAMLKKCKGRTLSGRDAFFLWDTAGFPFDITRRSCEDRGYQVDEAGYEQEMAAQRERARAGSQIASDIFGTGPAGMLKGRVDPTRFTGYERLQDEARVVALLSEAGKLVEAASSGRVVVVLDRTPCYGESGGQVGDTGRLLFEDGGSAAIVDTKKSEGYQLHQVELEQGSLAVGQSVRVEVDPYRRLDTIRNHTATHLLHWALRKVLGESVTQAGSLVHPDYLRFDYTSRGGLSNEQAEQIEDLVNQQVLSCLPVETCEKPYEAARQEGAMALFGEKYGDSVRVVSVLDEEKGLGFNSVELCGGTHCENTGQIGLFRIQGESAIAAGVRRITALTGCQALSSVRDNFRLSRRLSTLLKTRDEELPARVEGLLKERSKLEKEIARTKRETASKAAGGLLAGGTDLGGVTLFSQTLEGVGQQELRSLADQIIRDHAEGVAILAGVEGERVALVVACGKEAVGKGVKAGEIARQLGQALGGGGGGRPDMAQGQGGDPSALADALAAADRDLRTRLSEG